jgi:hypothetical protein
MSDKNPYGGSYVLGVDVSNPRQFVVEITGLTQADCKTLVTKAWSDSVGYKMSDGKVGGAQGSCENKNGTNVVKIVFGE